MKPFLISVRYEIFEYSGSAEAEVVLVSVGDASAVVRDTVSLLASRKVEVGAIVVHLLRPWDSERFLASVPSSGKIQLIPMDCTRIHFL